MQDALRQQSGGIEREAVKALAAPLGEIKQAAGQVRQNIKVSNWLFVAGIFLAGMVVSLMMGYCRKASVYTPQLFAEMTVRTDTRLADRQEEVQ